VIEKERIDEAKRNVKQYIDEGLLKIKDKEAQKFVSFFNDQYSPRLDLDSSPRQPFADSDVLLLALSFLLPRMPYL
jgi:hypothetical protein